MKTLPVYNTIEGMTGRAPVGAYVSVGRKGPTGAPVDRLGFFVMNYQATKTDANGRPQREPHPAFTAFNSRPEAERKIIKGVLVADTREASFQQRLHAYRGPNGTQTPGNRFWCFGGGVKATRWDGDEYREIKCPNELCEFRQGDKPICKPHTRITFLLRLDGCPQILAEWDSGAATSASNALGMFDYIAQVHREVGIDAHFFGLPFAMQVGEKTNAEKKRRYPVVTFTVEGNPVQATQAKLESVHRTVAALPGPVAVTPIGDGPEDSEAATREHLTPGQPYAPANIRASAPETPVEVSPATPPAKPSDRISKAEFDALAKQWGELDRANGGDGKGLAAWLLKHGYKKGSEIKCSEYAALLAEAGGAK